MNLKMSSLAFILPALILSASCKKNTATSPTSHGQITGQWQWQYTSVLIPGQISYPQQDSTVQIAFAIDTVNNQQTFTLSLNNNERASGTWQWQDSILVLTSSAPINNADYAQANIFNSTNPSEYWVKISPESLWLSKDFIIPGDPNPISVPAEPVVLVFAFRANPGGPSAPVN